MLASTHPTISSQTKHRNSTCNPLGQDYRRRKSFSLLCSVSLELPPAVRPFSHSSCDLQETAEYISLTCPFPHRHQHVRCPADELLHQHTLIPRSHHWLWLCLGSSGHINSIDWLIDLFIYLFQRRGEVEAVLVPVTCGSMWIFYRRAIAKNSAFAKLTIDAGIIGHALIIGVISVTHVQKLLPAGYSL